VTPRPFDRRDHDSPAHRAWVALLTQRLAIHREANDRLNSDERQTAITRGRIAELKELLALASPPAPANAADPEQASALGPFPGD
jgi:hypothetical protein